MTSTATPDAPAAGDARVVPDAGSSTSDALACSGSSASASSSSSLAVLRSARASLAGLVDGFDANGLSGFDAAGVVGVACQIERLAGGLRALALPRVLETGS